MAKEYDSELDTRKHIMNVGVFLVLGAQALLGRALDHDSSKLLPIEKEAFDRVKPRLDASNDLGSVKYESLKKELGEALQHHYKNNSHHPEHYPEGIDGMCLFDLVEMLCDWSDVAKRKGSNTQISLDALRDKYSIGDQLYSILVNTINRNEFL